MSTPPTPSLPPVPASLPCTHGAVPDPVTGLDGCRGTRVSRHTACLAHLADADRAAYLASLTPGAHIDHRGTTFTEDLLDQLLAPLRDPVTHKLHLGAARFDGAQFFGAAGFDDAQFFGAAVFIGAQFSGTAGFQGAQFSYAAWFDEAQFSGAAEFDYARFSGAAGFEEARFSGAAGFEGTQFSDAAGFQRAQFSDGAMFEKVQFSGIAWFQRARFSGAAVFIRAQFFDAGFQGAEFSDAAEFVGAKFSRNAGFEAAQFSGTASFTEAQFSRSAGFQRAQFSDTVRFIGAKFGDVPSVGPLVCAGRVVLAGAVFSGPVTLEIVAQEVDCERTRWDSTAIIRLRYAAVDLSHAVLSAPVAVISHPTFFVNFLRRVVDESLLAGRPDGVRVTSVQGVDAAHLVLTDTDLSDCLFSGAFHLDQLRLEGRTTLASVPTGWHHRGIWPVHWSRRRTLAEEHHWRAQLADQVALPGTAPPSWQWRPGPHHPDPVLTPDPEDVAALYRQLRKAFEDGKNEPGAADFYYGECEMRRHDTTGTPKGERRLLWAYWLLSGYGLRASRATGWLLTAMTITVLLLMGFGLPTHDPAPASTGTLHGSQISLTTSSPAPALHGGWPQRMTWPRAEKATRVAVNSVVFRSSGQNLTTAGTYIEMASRLLEPTLLALAALAVRGRIKR